MTNKTKRTLEGTFVCPNCLVAGSYDVITEIRGSDTKTCAKCTVCLHISDLNETIGRDETVLREIIKEDGKLI